MLDEYCMVHGQDAECIFAERQEAKAIMLKGQSQMDRRSKIHIKLACSRKFIMKNADKVQSI